MRVARIESNALRHSAEQALYCMARLCGVNPPGIARLERRHGAAHVLHALRAERRDGVLYCLLELGIGELLWQEALDNGDLAALLLGQLGPPALVVERNGLAPLLDHA